MPHCIISTNVLTASKGLSKKVATVVAEALSKPPKYVMSTIKVDENLTFGISDAPAALVNLGFIGSTDVEKNNSVVASLTALLNAELNIDPDRIYILVEAFPASAIALGGKSFA